MWSDNLRPEQAAAAGASRAHAVLLAGPGTGKTFVLVRRVEYLIEDLGVPAEEILALTFSRAAAAEMRARLDERLEAASKRVRVSTLHAFSLRKLLQNGASQLPAPLRVAGDWEERWVIVEELAHLLGKRVKDIKNNRDGLLDRLSDDWDTLDAAGDDWEDGFPDPKFLSVWQRHRWIYGYTLRSELVYQLLTELRANPEFDLGKISELLVDEYQDLNRCDLDTIALVAERTGAFVYVAGDDDQSIYSFRHAIPAGIRGFSQDYAESNRLTLSECLRCGEDVVRLVNWLIAQELNREEKELISITPWTASVHLLRFPNQEAEAAAVARSVQVDIEEGTKPEDILILVRSDTAGRISSAVQAALSKYDIEVYLPRAAKIEGAEVQRVLEYLTLALSLRENRVDALAVRSLLDLDSNGIGDARIERLMRVAFDGGRSFTDALEDIRGNSGKYPSSLGAVVVAFDEIVQRAKDLQALDGESFDQWLVRLSEALELPEDVYERVLEVSRSVAGAEGLELTDVSIEATGEGEETTPIEVSDYVAALIESMGSLSDVMPARLTGRVTFTTMHGAKGLTADTVYVLQAEDEVIPGGATGHELDESRRLLYVSLTRAKRRLLICACNRRVGPQRFAGQTEAEQRHLTRFLSGYGLKGQTIGQYLKSR
jgi:DNA helicase II / ATP-dependent DNA helicase PcrA